MAAPVLEGQALAAVLHRGSHLQIIAAAGSGKTEVVSQRVVSLLADGVAPEAIVAFTFTDRAAAELRERVNVRVEERMGPAALDRLGGLFVRTIHAYCFRLLQSRVPRYETYDVLDENQLNAFVAREADQLGIKVLDPKGNTRLFASIEAFLKGLDVVENELLDPASVPEPFAGIFEDYLICLERYRLLSYGQQIVRAVRELERPEVREAVHAELRHLIVDEYQDVNPGQERLIELLAGPKVELCVVGDDDQAIYQWRGSDVTNIVEFTHRIVEFTHRYDDVATFAIEKNRRSRPQIIQAANAFAETIPDRLPKVMLPFRTASPTGSSIAAWAVGYEQDQAGYIANTILDLNDGGLPYRDIAVLVRSRAAYARLLEEFATFGIVAELQQRRSKHLVSRDQATDFIVTGALTADALAQYAVNPEVADVFDQLLGDSEFELDFVKYDCGASDEPITFRALVRGIAKRGEIALGYRLKDTSGSGDTYKLKLNPPKSETIERDALRDVLVLARRAKPATVEV